jgi:hypothetical protein
MVAFDFDGFVISLLNLPVLDGFQMSALFTHSYTCFPKTQSLSNSARNIKKNVHFIPARKTTTALYPKAIKIKSNAMTTNVVAAPLTSPVVEEDSPASDHHNGSTNALQSIHQARSSFLSLAATRVSNNRHTHA